MANAFIPKEYDKNGVEKKFVNHKDLNPWNNNISNLEWCTQSENSQHAFDNDAMNHVIDGDESIDFLFVTIGTRRSWKDQIGEGNNNSRMTNEQVHIICKALEKGKSTREIVDMLGIRYDRNNIALISSIRQGKRWVHISSQYNISKLFERKTKAITPYLKEICQMILNGKTDDEIIETIPHEGYDEFRFKYFLTSIRNRKRHQSLLEQLSNNN